MMSALTGLRAVAAFWVVLFHFAISPLGTLHLRDNIPLLAHGYLGVDLFFILSGFVIAHAHFDDFNVLEWPKVRRFYIYRIARFYPLYICVLAGLAAVVLLGKFIGFGPASPENFTVLLLVANILIVQAWWQALPSWNYPAWSLSCEWFVYLLFPLIARALRPLRSGFALILAFSIVLMLFLFAYALIFNFQLNFLDTDHRPGLALCRVSLEFLGGVILYRILNTFDGSIIPWSVLAAGGAGLSILAAKEYLDLAIIGLFLIIIAAGKYRNNLIARILSRRPLIYLGEISYALYIIHAPVQMTIGKAVARWLETRNGLPVEAAATVFMLALTILLAAGAHHLIEVPARRWIRARIQDPDRSPGARLAAPVMPSMNGVERV